MTARRDRETLDYEDRQEKFWLAEDRRRRRLMEESEYICASCDRPMTTDDHGWWFCQRCGTYQGD